MLFSVVFILSQFLAIATGFFVFVNIEQNPGMSRALSAAFVKAKKTEFRTFLFKRILV